MRWLGLLSVALLVAASLACRGHDDPFAHLPFDVNVAAVDAGTPTQRFDGSGSILLGPGWAPPERAGPAWARFSFAWAIRGRSDAWFLRPAPGGPFDLLVDLKPYTYPGAQPQLVRVRLNDRWVGRHLLTSGWQEVRLPLPDEALAPGPNHLRFRFRDAVEPRRVSSNPDNRALSAAFRTIAVVPHAWTEPAKALRRLHLDPRGRRIELVAGGAYEAPLPRAAHVEWTFASVASDPGCRLAVSRIRADGAATTLWSGSAAQLAGRSIEVTTPAGLGSRLRIAVPLDSCRAGEGGVSIRLSRQTPRIRGGKGSRARTDPAAPYVFLYLIDTLRADVLEPYGAPAGSSPQIAAFARGATTYLDAWAPSTWTLPATASILTGVYPFRHGLMQGKVKLTPASPETLAHRLGAAGYATVGVSQSFVAGPAFGLDVGFGSFYVNNHLGSPTVRSERLTRYLIDWLWTGRAAGRPFFAYLHGVAPHAPYAPPPAYRGWAERAPGDLPAADYDPFVFLARHLASNHREVRHLEGLYRGEVAYADAQFGRFVGLLRYLGIFDQSLVVLVSDHGEEFGEHGGFDHGRTLFEELVHVPLVVHYPGGRAAGRRIPQRVSTVDIVPTVLAVAGIAGDREALEGSVLPTTPAARPPRRAVFSEVNPSAAAGLAAVDLKAIAAGGWKCIESDNRIDQLGRPIPAWRAFDLSRDPGDRHPLGPPQAVEARCSRLLYGWLARELAGAGDAAKPTAASREALDTLRALGYVQ